MSGDGTPTSDERPHERIALRSRLSVVAVAAVVTLATFGAAHADDGDADRVAGRSVAVATTDAAVDDAGAAPTDPPSGDDPELDALAEQCFEGDLMACDSLFLQAPVDSEYEAYGDTCGGRQEAGTEEYCALTSSSDEPVVPDAPVEPSPPVELGTDPDLDALAGECYVGDMDACDALYDEADAGSQYQIYGDTCAGRQPEATGEYCRDLENPLPGIDPISGTPDDTVTAQTEPVDTEPVDTVPVQTDPVETDPVETDPVQTDPVDTLTVDTEPVDTDLVEGDVPPATQQPDGLGADAELDSLAQDCFDGDMDACDELYNASEPDTEYRRYGDTCAGRQPEASGTWCRDAFGGEASSTDVTTGPPTTTEQTATTVPVSTVPPPTVPPATVPPVTVPPPTVPPLTVPPLTVPPPTAPPLTVPPLPPITAPPVTADTVAGASTTPATTLPTGVIPPATLQPVGLGADPALDALAQGCFDGDMASCDELFRQSDPASAVSYRDYGDTCAGRQPSGTGRWCEASFPVTGPATTVPGPTVAGTVTPVTAPPGTAVVPPGGIPAPTQLPTGLGNDPQLDTLAQGCYDGAMQSCDDLFLQSELGSPYHEYGDTCAGRQNSGTYTYCVIAFPTGQP